MPTLDGWTILLALEKLDSLQAHRSLVLPHTDLCLLSYDFLLVIGPQPLLLQWWASPDRQAITDPTEDPHSNRANSQLLSNTSLFWTPEHLSQLHKRSSGYQQWDLDEEFAQPWILRPGHDWVAIDQYWHLITVLEGDFLWDGFEWRVAERCQGAYWRLRLLWVWELCRRWPTIFNQRCDSTSEALLCYRWSRSHRSKFVQDRRHITCHHSDRQDRDED